MEMPKLPKVGMRTVKTAVAVVVCYLLFLPFWTIQPGAAGGFLRYFAPINACIAAIICMQSSIGQSFHVGAARIVGTLLGGVVGLAGLMLSGWFRNPIATGAVLGGSIILALWLCNLIKRPAACSMSSVVVCVILLTPAGEGYYVDVIFRVLESIVGIAVALAVNRVLPDHRSEENAQ